jgi:hypothetical protein
MTYKDFNWNPETWTVDYKAEFLKLKEAICKSCTLYAPDNTLPWVGRSDASQCACSIVIYQIAIIDDKRVYQLIGIASKFSNGTYNFKITSLVRSVCNAFLV